MNKFKIIISTASITLLLATSVFAFIYINNVNKFRKQTTVESNFGAENNNLQLTKEELIEKNNSEINSGRKNVITETVKKVSPAIVGVNVTEIREYRDPWSQDPFFRQFFGDRVYRQAVKSLGSGAIISPDGYIITNDHVAGNASEVIVTMTDGTQHKAKIVGTDKISDICLLKIDGNSLPYIKFGNSDNILIGEWAIALGNPFGLFSINDKPTVTLGVISSLGMNLGSVEGRYYLDMIQTDAPINSGNSGGPLVNSIGELIGMNTIIYTPQGSSGSVGVGFSIPINKVKKVITELKNNGEIDRNFWTGIKVQNVDEKIRRYFRLPDSKGVIITEIEEGSPADKANLQVGDIFRRVDKFKIDDVNMLFGVIYEYRPNETITVEVLRDSEKFVTKMKLEPIKD